MKTTMILATLLTFSGVAQADSIRDGHFQGKGLWKSETATGSYEVTTDVAGSLFSSSYKLANGQTIKTAMELKPAANGFLKVIDGGKQVGTGYCIEREQLCHYEVKNDKISLEETLTIQNGKLYKFGSKTTDGVTVMWQEALGN
ncbi:MAG: hypothetical protein ACXVB9_04955 [Bdellovibrionota bacterium]